MTSEASRLTKSAGTAPSLSPAQTEVPVPKPKEVKPLKPIKKLVSKGEIQNDESVCEFMRLEIIDLDLLSLLAYSESATLRPSALYYESVSN